MSGLAKYQIRLFSKKAGVSSRQWLKRHIKDPFVRLAQQEDQVSRSYYKLKQLDTKFRIFPAAKEIGGVVDLGAAPGGWTSYVIGNVRPPPKVLVAIDLTKLDNKVLSQGLKNFHFQQGDFRELKEDIVQSLPNQKATVVLSDMAPHFSGDQRTDILRSVALCEQALDFAMAALEEGGSFVGKIFSSPELRELKEYAKTTFDDVHVAKPGASRKESSEQFLVARGFRH